MVLSIKSRRADELARELAALTGESISQAVETAVEERLQTERHRRSGQSLADIVERFRALPVLDPREPEALLEYDEHGLPT